MRHPNDVSGAVQRAIEHGSQGARTSVHVEVRGDQVVLSGVVDTLAQRQAAERTAAETTARLPGKFRIENEITIAGNGAHSDREFEQALDRMLAEVPDLAPKAVGARVERGVALLVGHVSSAAHVEAAIAAARQVPGLKKVVSQIQLVTGAPPDVDLINRVSQALSWDTHVNKHQITVEAGHDGTVTLSGEVDTPEERERAQQVARGVTGVHQVVNRIRSRQT